MRYFAASGLWHLGGVMVVAESAGLLAGCGHPASPSGIPAAHLYAPSTACHPSPPDVVPFSDSANGKWYGSPHIELAIVIGTLDQTHPEYHALPFYANGAMWIGFTDDAQAPLSQLRAGLHQPQLLRAYCAPYSIRDLNTVTDQLRRDSVLRSHRVDVVNAGLDINDGRVEVQVAMLDPDTAILLHERYGDIIGQVVPFRVGEGIAG